MIWQLLRRLMNGEEIRLDRGQVQALKALCPNEFGAAFNLNQEGFSRLPDADEDLDMMVTYRLRAFGDNNRKRAVMGAEFPGLAQTINPYCISTNPPQIVVDRKMIRLPDGQLKYVEAAHQEGHEAQHAKRVILSRWTLRSEDPATDGSPLLSPDEYVTV
ncbi:MAG TPA: hypothetical protein PLL15_05795 [Syntrophales bacterium]|nr:hypothetical protein [Syntrophales bacterium]